MRLLVTGSREWPGTWHDIAAHVPWADGPVIIHGACSRFIGGRQVSVDMIVDELARDMGSLVEPYPVSIDADGPWPGAGPARNRRMLRLGKPTHGLAFGPLLKRAGSTQTTGTGHMVGLLRRAGIPVQWVSEPGASAIDLAPLAPKER